MKNILFAIIFVFIITNDVFACSPPPPGAGIHRLNNISPKIVSSSNGRFFLKLMPGKWVSNKRTFSGIQIREAYGIVFEVRKDGQFQQIWSFKNWDENNLVFYKPGYPLLHLSNDGSLLVKISENVNNASDKSAVVVYKNGQKVKSYSPADFGVKDIMKNPCGGGYWLDNSEIRMSDIVGIKVMTGKNWTIGINGVTEVDRRK